VICRNCIDRGMILTHCEASWATESKLQNEHAAPVLFAVSCTVRTGANLTGAGD
jgi:hypothetical protein